MRITIAVVLTAWLQLAAAAAPPDQGHYVSVLGDYLLHPSGNHMPQLKNGYGLDAGYGTVVDDHWAYEFRLAYGTLKPKPAGASDGYHSTVGLDAMYRFSPLWGLTPFALGGGGLGYSNLASDTAQDPRAGFLADLGAGVLTKPFVEIMGWPLSARGQVKADYEHYDRGYLDVRVYAGLQLALSSPPPPTPEEKAVVVPPIEPPPASAPVVETPPPAPTVAEPVEEPDQGPTIETAKAGDTIALRGVNFETAKAKLTSNAKTILDGIAEQLAKRPELNIEIGGHTDGVGKTAYNQKLSERRAQAVLDYLVSKGVDTTHLTAAGYGKTMPVDTNDTDEGRERNRRVELKIKAEGAGAPPVPEPAADVTPAGN